jgi:hypothetical protein
VSAPSLQKVSIKYKAFYKKFVSVLDDDEDLKKPGRRPRLFGGFRPDGFVGPDLGAGARGQHRNILIFKSN